MHLFTTHANSPTTYLLIFLFLLQIVSSSPVKAQVTVRYVPVREIEIKEYEPEPDYIEIIKRKTGVENVKKLNTIGYADSCYVVSFAEIKGKWNNSYPQLGIAQVELTEAKDTIVHFISDYRFSSVDDYFFDDYLDVAVYDTVSHRVYQDLMHKSGKILGNFEYLFLTPGPSSTMYSNNNYSEKPRYAFIDGLARVEKRVSENIYYDSSYRRRNQKRSYMDLSGRIITDSLLYNVYAFQGDLALAAIFDEQEWEIQYGCIDRNGKLIIPFKYNEVRPYDENHILAIGRGTNGTLYDRQGNLVVEGVQSVKTYSDTLWLIIGSAFNEYSFYFNPKTRKTLSKKYHFVTFTGSEGLPAMVRFVNNQPRTHWMGEYYIEKYGLVDTLGREILPVIYDGLSYFNDYRLALASLDNKVAWVNEKGHFITEWFDRANVFEEPGIAWVQRNNLWALINKEGEIISDWYEQAWNFKEGLSRVRVGKYIGCIDQSGAMVIEPQFPGMEPFENGYAIVRSKKKKNRGKLGVINRKGELVIPMGKYKEKEIKQIINELGTISVGTQ